MRKLYREGFGPPSACIAYGANIEGSSNPEILKQYGLEPGNYYLIASRLVPENNAALIVEGFQKSATRRVLAIAGDANYKAKFIEDLKATAGDPRRFLRDRDTIHHVHELARRAHAPISCQNISAHNPHP